MHGSSCRLPKDVCGCSSTMRELACVEKRGKEVYPTRHQAWSFHMVSGLETVRRFSVRGCTMLSGSRREQGVKCQGTQSDCPTEYLGVTCSELCILRDSAKGFSWTVQLNTLASRETSST
jgi:hypothetical protein